MSRAPLLFLLLVLILLGGGVLAQRTDLFRSVVPVSSPPTPAPLPAGDVQELHEPEVVAPGGLRVPIRERGAVLTRAGVWQETNTQRVRAGAASLHLSEALNRAAEQKAQGMFARQYFSHVSPDGKDAGDFVKAAHYASLRVGENLAVGNFANDEALVQAWMESPGHRANILEPRYTEIGIAAVPGMFEGRQTWMAVQVFALPRSACRALDEKLAARIAEQKRTYEALGAEAEQLGTAGNAKVEEGNREMAEGNRIYQKTGERDAAQPHWDRGEPLQAAGRALFEQAEATQTQAKNLANEIQENIDRYNAQIHALNTCVNAA